MRIGPAPAAESYRNTEAILAAARETGAAAIHPGYGFLSENAAFAQAVTDAGLIWVGPSPAAITAMGDKIGARNLMAAAGVPIAPGTEDPVADAEAAAAAAAEIGYPVMIKAAAGGGGMGMAVVQTPEALPAEFEKVTGFAGRLFGDSSVFVERFFPSVRHVEIQILGLADGTRAGPGRAGLLGAAPQPEGGRGNPVAGGGRGTPGADEVPPPGPPARPSTTGAPAPWSSCSTRPAGSSSSSR